MRANLNIAWIAGTLALAGAAAGQTAPSSDQWRVAEMQGARDKGQGARGEGFSLAPHPSPLAPHPSPLAPRVALERAQAAQADVLKDMTELLSGRQRSASTVELINALTQIHQMQVAVLQRTQVVVAATFGTKLEELNETARQTNEQLAVDQRSVRQRLADWVTAFTRFASAPNSAEGIRRMQSQAANSPAGEFMDQSVEHIAVNHLSDAVTSEQQAADRLVRLIQSMEALTTDPEQVRQKRLRELMDIAELEKGVLARLKPPPGGQVRLPPSGPSGASGTIEPDPLPWQQVRREQDVAAERTRLMTFDEAGMPPAVLERVRAALKAMQTVQSSLRPTPRNSKYDRAEESARQAIAILDQAIQLLQQTAEGKDPDLPLSNFNNDKSNTPPTPMQMLANGAGVPLPDMSAMAQLAADISLVTKMLRAEKALRAEVTGKVPPMPNPAERQIALAGQLSQVVRRVAACLPSAGAALDQARAAMNQAADRLQAGDTTTAADHQAKAIEQLTDADTRMRQFWKQLLEALSKISSGAAGVANAPGASDEETDKAQMELLLKLLPELVRLGELVTNLEGLAAQTSAWASTAPAESQASLVAGMVKKHRELCATGRDIANRMSDLGEQVSGTVPKTIREAIEFMDGAAVAMGDGEFEKANGRQVDALDILRHAWAIVASRMASLSNIQQGTPNQPGSTPGQAGANSGEGGAGGASETVTGDHKPWYWTLPPQARDAIAQSLADPFPPQYAPAVKRYYERLSNRKAPQ